MTVTAPILVASLSVAEHGEGWAQLRGLLIAFGLCSLIGLERQVRGKEAGLRTQAIVGTTAALILLVSKFGFTDVLAPKLIVVDPSRVAAQIVSGIGFLGAGIILTRQGRVRGLTTAASVWEAAAIGMAAGAGLDVLALVVTGLHFFAIAAYTPLTRRLPGTHSRSFRVEVAYADGEGVLREILAACAQHDWVVSAMRREERGGLAAVVGSRDGSDGNVVISLGLRGPGASRAPSVIGGVAGVVAARADPDEDEED